MSKENSNPLVSKHLTEKSSFLKSFETDKSVNKISEILFEREKTRIQEEIIKNCTGTYEKAITVIEKWKNELSTIKPQISFQSISGSSQMAEVKTLTAEQKAQSEKLTEKLTKLISLFDEAYEKSTVDSYNALETFLSKNK